mmetsp:Transcript_95696/g.310054  ORF Transcript_95696/g.310054 Transcript_95696/m.310054 type:complete len:285 (-) Transcript_95696:1081-1935(-)
MSASNRDAGPTATPQVPAPLVSRRAAAEAALGRRAVCCEGPAGGGCCADEVSPLSVAWTSKPCPREVVIPCLAATARGSGAAADNALAWGSTGAVDDCTGPIAKLSGDACDAAAAGPPTRPAAAMASPHEAGGRSEARRRQSDSREARSDEAVPRASLGGAVLPLSSPKWSSPIASQVVLRPLEMVDMKDLSGVEGLALSWKPFSAHTFGCAQRRAGSEASKLGGAEKLSVPPMEAVEQLCAHPLTALCTDPGSDVDDANVRDSSKRSGRRFASSWCCPQPSKV